MGRGPEYRIFPKTHRWPIDMWKDAQLHYSLGKFKSQPQWDMTSHWSEWLFSNWQRQQKQALLRMWRKGSSESWYSFPLFASRQHPLALEIGRKQRQSSHLSPSWTTVPTFFYSLWILHPFKGLMFGGADFSWVAPLVSFCLPGIWKPSTCVLMFGHLKRSVLICIFCGILFGLKKIAYAFADYFPNKFLWNKTSTLFVSCPSEMWSFKLFPNIGTKSLGKFKAKLSLLRDFVS